MIIKNETSYKGIKIYEITVNGKDYYGIKTSNGKSMNISENISDLKESIDRDLRNKTFTIQQERAEKTRNLNEKNKEKERETRLYNENAKIVKQVLDDLIRKTKRYPNGIITELHYKDKYFKTIFIKHLGGKKFRLKISRGKERVIYYQELFNKQENENN